MAKQLENLRFVAVVVICLFIVAKCRSAVANLNLNGAQVAVPEKVKQAKFKGRPRTRLTSLCLRLRVCPPKTDRRHIVIGLT